MQDPIGNTMTPNMERFPTYTFNVTMTCGGCSGAIERVLGKMPGIQSYKVSLDTQAVIVVPGRKEDEPANTAAEPPSYEAILEKIKKTGKKVNSGAVDGEKRDV